MIYRLPEGLGEVVQFLSIHTPVKATTDAGAAQPELNVIPVVDRRVLDTVNPKFVVADEETYSDHLHEGTGGTNYSLGQWVVVYRQVVQDIDGRIQGA